MAEWGGIRLAKAEDVNSLAAIERKCFGDRSAYSRKQIQYLVTKANSVTLVMEIEGVIAGFVICLFKKRTRVSFVETIDVDPTFRGLGIGPRLLVAAEQVMREKGIQTSQLEVSELNMGAIKVYERACYTVKVRMPDYYIYEQHGTRNALRMTKRLN